MSSAAAQERFAGDPEGAKAAIADVRKSAREALVEMSAMLQQLRPAPLESVGLHEALREQGDALSYRTGAVVHLDLEQLDDDLLPVGAQETLFRIAQEAFANVARHAKAGKVAVTLRVDDEDLAFTVEDDGQGFDIDTPTPGSGLRNMSERADVIGGRLSVTSDPDGTRVQAIVPLKTHSTRWTWLTRLTAIWARLGGRQR